MNGAGIPLLGMATYLPLLSSVLNPLQSRARVYESGSDPQTASNDHCGFDNDVVTMNTLLREVLGGEPGRLFTKGDLDY